MIIKNSNLRSNLFSNRYKILGVIVAIILVLCGIRLLNNMSKEKLQTPTIYTTTGQSTYKPQETVISGDNVVEEQQEANKNVMDQFIKYCNEKEVEKAYSLLTDECKEVIYDSNIDNFRKNYVEKIYTSNKTYSMQSWIRENSSVTYKVRIIDDILSTGKVGDVVEDYYTVVKQNGSNKLNINSYIGRSTINKLGTQNNITIDVISKDTYMNYETYNIKVENNTNNTILLDTKQSDKSVYLTGNNDVTYRAFMYEIDNVYLTIKPKIYTNFTIKFNKMYNPSIKEKSITFSDIINNAEISVGANLNRTNITIEL